MATASPNLAVPHSLRSSSSSSSSPLSPLRLRHFAPRASVSSGSPTTSWLPGADVRPASDSLWTPTASQGAPAAVRSAEADVMGLMLRQRIVFLGSQMDDFVADAIISQLLLLDAVDPKKDIRLFVNCPGGSIRYVLVLVFYGN
jgi:ATP-dependent Clp protease protease subunit